jgi:hypothetical protein
MGALMVILFCSTTVGVILGLRYGIFVMLPATLLTAAGVFANGIWRGDDFRIIAVGSLEAVVCLQFGYLIGCSVVAYWTGRARADPSWGNSKFVLLDELIFRGEPDSSGERDQWVLVSDPKTGEQCVRHDRVALDEGPGSPYVQSEPTVPVAEFLETDQPPKVKRRLLSILSRDDGEKS